MASVTVWTARRAANRKGWKDPLDKFGRLGFGPHILCGFGRAELGNWCDEVIAWVAEEYPGHIVIPDGVTDAGTPGRYRVGADATRRAERGQDVILRRRRNDPDLAGRVGFPAPLRMVRPPVILPCAKGHSSRIDESHLAR